MTHEERALESNAGGHCCNHPPLETLERPVSGQAELHENNADLIVRILPARRRYPNRRFDCHPERQQPLMKYAGRPSSSSRPRSSRRQLFMLPVQNPHRVLLEAVADTLLWGVEGGFAHNGTQSLTREINISDNGVSAAVRSGRTGKLCAQHRQDQGSGSASSGALVPGAMIVVPTLTTGARREDCDERSGVLPVPAVAPGRLTRSHASASMDSKQVTRDASSSILNQVGASASRWRRRSDRKTIDAGSRAATRVEQPRRSAVMKPRPSAIFRLNGRNFRATCTPCVPVVHLGCTRRPARSQRNQAYDMRPVTILSNVTREQSNTSCSMSSTTTSAATVSSRCGPSVDAVREFKIQTNLFSGGAGADPGAIST